ncbi:hypothetical protein RU639_008921 [Aspergillus parasiticus]
MTRVLPLPRHTTRGPPSGSIDAPRGGIYWEISQDYKFPLSVSGLNISHCQPDIGSNMQSIENMGILTDNKDKLIARKRRTNPLPDSPGSFEPKLLQRSFHHDLAHLHPHPFREVRQRHSTAVVQQQRPISGPRSKPGSRDLLLC